MKRLSIFSIKRSTPFWLFSLSLVFGLTLPWLIQDGMFQDAVLYSAVSNNLANGIGSFWFLQYSALNLEGIPSFHEQLPLVFGIQALFFKLLGNSLYVERFYTFLMIILNIFLILKIWKIIFKDNNNYSRLGWLPVFFWIIIPLTFWSYRYNMLENTVSVFVLSSVLLSLKAVQSKRGLFFWIMSGLFIFFASFSKGVPGLFPVIFPLLYWLTTKKISFKKSIFYSFILVCIPTIIYLILIAFPESRDSLSIYFFERLLGRTTSMPTTDYHAEIIVRLLMELIPVLIIVVLVLLSRFRSIKATLSENTGYFLLFFGLGISGTFPLALTLVQKGFYMIPAFPFFAIAFGVLITPILSNHINKINIKSKPFKGLTYFSLFILLGVFIVTFALRNDIEREKEVITDVYKTGEEVPQLSIVTVPDEMYYQYDFILQGYLVRYFNISISPYEEYHYYLKEKTLDVMVPDHYKKVELPLTKYELYKKSD